MSYDTKIDMPSFHLFLKALAIPPNDPVHRKLGNAFGENYLKFIDDQFTSEGEYFGGWAELAPSTLESKAKSKDLHGDPAQMLILSGRMRAAWSYNLTGSEIDIFNNMESDSGAPYPAFQQYGIPSNNLPAREMVDFDRIPAPVMAGFIEDAVYILRRYL